MNIFDWVALAVLFISTLLGFLRGSIITVFALAGWIAAGVLAARFGDECGTLLLASVQDPAWRHFGGMILVFVAVKLAVSLLGYLFSRLARAVGLGLGDRLLGAVIGIGRGLALLVMIAIAIGFTAIPRSQQWRDSFSGPRLEAAAREFRPWLPESVAGWVRPGSTE